MTQIEQITNCFKKVFPNPTDGNRRVLLGNHLVAIGTMAEGITISCSVGTENMDYILGLKWKGELFIKNNSFYKNPTIENKTTFAHGIAQQLFTLIGLAYMNEIDLEGALQEVIRSNNTKFDDTGNPIFDENGKLTKGKNYSPPDLVRFIREQKISETYKWYLGSSDECYDLGQYETKEDALKEAALYDEPVYLCKARKEHLVLLSDTIDIDTIIDNAEDIASGEYLHEHSNIDVFFDITDEQKNDLEKTIKEAVNEWQTKHNLMFKSQILYEVSDEEELIPSDINKLVGE